jgi:hypothetical protein
MRGEDSDPPIPCTWDSNADCTNCIGHGRLKCRFNFSDLFHFWAITLAVTIPALGGMLLGGHLLYVILYLIIFAIMFYFVVPSFLCRHCPYYAEKGLILHCPAHYGSIKLLKYSPVPLNRGEKTLVPMALIVLFGFPVPFLIYGQQWILLSIMSWNLLVWFFTMLKYICSSCINFSCPMNRAPKELAEAYRSLKPWSGKIRNLGPMI